jgi:hypothetical protein
MSKMQWSLDVTIGKLFRFWWWCVDYAEDGDLSRHNDERLGSAVGLNGDEAKLFVQAMIESCWIDREPSFRVHDWWKHFGAYLRSKYKQNPEKWQKIRDSYLNSGNGSINRSSNGCTNRTPNLTKPNLTKSPPTPLAGGEEFAVPKALDSPEFRDAWAEWLAYRSERKPKVSPRAARQQLRDLEAWGVERAVTSIRNSIRNSWQGLFPPDGAEETPEQRAKRLVKRMSHAGA